MRFLFAAFVVSFNIFAEEVIWLVDDARELANFGKATHYNITTDTMNLLLDEIPNIKVKFQEAQSARTTKLVYANKNYCAVNWIKTDQRALKSYYSLPLCIYPGLRVYYLADHLTLGDAELDSKGQLKSLQSLIQHNPKLAIGLIKDRSYGRLIDKQLSELPAISKYVRSGNAPYQSLEQMLIRNRVQIIIDYPSEMADFEAKYGLDGKLRSVRLKGDEHYILGHIACSKNELGKQVVTEVDKALIKLYPSTQYLNAHMRHLSPADREAFKAYYLKALLN